MTLRSIGWIGSVHQPNLATLNERGVGHLFSHARQYNLLLERALAGEELWGADPIPASIAFGPTPFDTAPGAGLAGLVIAGTWPVIGPGAHRRGDSWLGRSAGASP